MIVVALTAVAAVRRRGMLPIDGFWFDDSWVVAGAVFGDPSQILSVGSTHPTFTLSLMGIALFFLVGLVERLVIPWHHETRRAATQQ